MKYQCRGIKSNFPWKPTFENGSHAKSAMQIDLMDLLSKSIGVLERKIWDEIH